MTDGRDVRRAEALDGIGDSVGVLLAAGRAVARFAIELVRSIGAVAGYDRN